MNKLRIEFKIALILASALIGSEASASSTLKQVQALEGGRVELVFDGKIKSNQIQTDFFGDTIQLTFKDAAVYPAKISNLNGHSVSKIFAYQYAPRVVRCRLTIKGKAEDFKSSLQVQASGKSVAIVLGTASASDSIGSSQAASTEKASADAEKSEDSDRELQERITAGTSNAVVSNSKKSAKDSARTEKSEPLATGKPIGNPAGVIGKLAIVLAIFLAGAWIVRRTLQGKGGKSLQSLGMLGKLAGLKKNSPIEVIASHYLGPKKSIAVVKIAGRSLVLGVTEESINLITQLGAASASGVDDAFDASTDSDAEMILDQLAVKRPTASVVDARATAPAGASFDQALGQAESIPSAASVKKSNVRSQIRSRLEGMKQL